MFKVKFTHKLKESANVTNYLQIHLITRVPIWLTWQTY